jgi:hypothetical protein
MKWMLVVLVGGVSSVNTDLSLTSSPIAWPRKSRCVNTIPTLSMPETDQQQPASSDDATIPRPVT